MFTGNAKTIFTIILGGNGSPLREVVGIVQQFKQEPGLVGCMFAWALFVFPLDDLLLCREFRRTADVVAQSVSCLNRQAWVRSP